MSGYAETDVRSLYGGALVASGAASTVILGPFDLSRWPNRSLCLYNMGATTLSGAVVQVNPDPFGSEPGVNPAVAGKLVNPPNSGLWINYDTTTFQSLATAQVRGTTLPGMYRYWRVVGTVDNVGLPSTTVSGYITAASQS